jgi:alpha-1,3-rhamnosyl/mannosyltransferase
MRVIINQLAATGQKTGVGHYTSQLVRYLRQQAIDDRIDVFPGSCLLPMANTFLHLLPYLKALRSRSRRLSRYRWLTYLGSLPRGVCRVLAKEFQAAIRHYRRSVFSSGAYDLYHEPNFIPFPCDLRTVITLHDLSVLLHPEWHPPERVARYEARFSQGLEQCEHFLTDSEFIRQQAIRYLNIAPERVTCVYPGVRPHLRPLTSEQTAAGLRRLGLKPGYLLYLGTLEPRKNILMLMRAYCALPEEVRERSPLVLVGRWGWRTKPIEEYYHAEGRHRGVQHLGYLRENLLPALYNGARALVYPSFYEGFGLPPVEMMACGGAVLASTADTLVETLGGQAHLISPHDPDAWREGMRRIIEDDDWLALLRNGASRVAQTFSWERCAADTLRVYRSLMMPRAVRRSGQRAA